jgi:hypothetical protein
MTQIAITSDVLETYVGRLMAQIQDEYRAKLECEAANFDCLTRLLKEMGRVSWALRPRTYAVLWMINRLDAMESFVEQDLLDISFPYAERTLPSSLTGMSDRLLFIEMQGHVLSAAKDIENMENQRHLNFRTSSYAQSMHSLFTYFLVLQERLAKKTSMCCVA